MTGGRMEWRRLLELIRDEQVASALVLLYRGLPGEVPPAVSDTLRQSELAELADGTLRLTKHGRIVGYQLSEYRTQVEERSAERLVALLDIRSDSRVLDIGCGAGQTLAAVARREPQFGVGIELDAPSIGMFPAMREYGNMGNVVAVRGDAERLPFRARSFDRVVCRGVLPFLRVPIALAEIARVTAPRGLVYLHILDVWFFLRKFLRLQWERAGIPLALVNGLLFQTFGVQIKVRTGRTMNYQTIGHMVRLLRREGFDILSVDRDPSRLLSEGHRQPKILVRRR